MVHSNQAVNDKEQRYWYALYTRPRFEKRVDQELQELAIETFLPVRTVMKTWSDRRKLVSEPLFPSYIFVYVNSREQGFVYQPRGIVRLVSFNGHPARIPEEQIEAVRRVLASGYSPVAHPYIAKGDPIEVVSGPLVGLRGFVVDYRGRNHFVISIEGISQSMLVNIDAADLKPIPKTTSKAVSNRRLDMATQS